MQAKINIGTFPKKKKSVQSSELMHPYVLRLGNTSNNASRLLKQQTIAIIALECCTT